MLDVLIVGGGITGLAAGFEAQKRGLTFAVLESGAAPGGVIGSVRRDGWTMELGAESMLASKPAARELCQEMGIADQLIATNEEWRGTHIVVDGRVVDLPAGASPVDFAYAVHTNLGHRCRGARVDGQLVPLNTPLRDWRAKTVWMVGASTGIGQATASALVHQHEQRPLALDPRMQERPLLRPHPLGPRRGPEHVRDPHDRFDRLLVVRGAFRLLLDLLGQEIGVGPVFLRRLVVVLLDAANIYNTFYEAMQAEGWSNGLPTNALLISGPSKTADIQQTLAYGAHGPKELVVLMIEENLQ